MVPPFLKDETLWQTQKALAELFGVQRPAITKHLKNIFETGELEEEVVCSILELTTPHGALEGKTQSIHGSSIKLPAEFIEIHAMPMVCSL